MEALIPFVFIPLFVLLWVGVAGLISLVGGWRGVAQSNPPPPALHETGEVYSFQSVRFGLMGNYNSTVNVTVYRQGIGMVPIILFKMFHDPIYIGFDAMTDVAYGRFLFHYMTFTLAGKKKIMLMGRCVPAIRERLGGVRGPLPR